MSLKTRKSYKQVPITATRCGRCLNLKEDNQGSHFCEKRGGMFAPEELVPKDFGRLCQDFKPLTK